MFRLSKVISDFSKTFPLKGNKTLLRTAIFLHTPGNITDETLQGNVVACVDF